MAYSSPIASQPGQGFVSDGLEAGAEELGWDVQIYDANLQPSAQVSDVQTMIQQQKAAIGLWPLDAGALSGSFAQADSAGIPVVAVNTEGDQIDATVWWETNRCEEGSPYVRDAERIAAAKPGGNVIVMGGPAVPSIQANVACFTEAAEAAGLTVLTQVDNTSDSSAGAATLASDVLTRYPDVDAFWTYNDSSALGISSSVIAAGQPVQSGDTEGIIIIGTNGDAEAIDAVRQGRITGTWDTDPYATGLAVVRAMRDAVENGSGDPLVVEAVYFDASNIGDYQPPTERDYSVDDIPLVDAGS
ncbi:sugar ABC transporter substrate-binding protein [Blastococcus sp. BMG 814]|uniref:Sugar ABC transporter substrate-binding protein n=1 Tax=Blastococcus carthaginiensis TaxID=3050034 RepID=A0ABT9IAB6_9ACTN|nr:sugar ABC transporter substrate-binding protein [Blastococcus carthaginiensis]MDP5182513.1 sugar ABC transporter substrate-binding protein [Blastococcus carthaginiensis]